jgi:uncharacterized membrane protein YfcA
MVSGARHVSMIPGLILALLIGLSLGMLGGGGSILTVPVFVYVLGFDPKIAIAMSYPVVGLTTLIGAIGRLRAGTVNVQRALIVGSASMVSAFVVARLSHGVKGTLQLAILGLVMLASAVTMLRSASRAEPAITAAPRPALLAFVGLGVGSLTGLVGVGGGFLIVPALVGFGGVAMREAIGTSLLIITANCVAGFAGQQNVAALPWDTIVIFTGVSMGGLVLGTRLAKQVPVGGLKRGFAVLLLVIAAVLLWQNRSLFGG